MIKSHFKVTPQEIVWGMISLFWILGFADFSADDHFMWINLPESAVRGALSIFLITGCGVSLAFWIYKGMPIKLILTKRNYVFVILFFSVNVLGMIVGIFNHVPTSYVMGDSRHMIVYILLPAMLSYSLFSKMKLVKKLIYIATFIMFFKLCFSLAFEVYLGGTLGQRFFMSRNAYMLVSLPVGLAYAVFAQAKREKMQGFLLAAMSGIIISTSQTRGAIIVAFFLMFSISLFALTNGRFMAIISILVVTLAFAVGIYITDVEFIERFSVVLNDSGASIRRVQIDSALKMLNDHFYFGAGLGGVDVNYERFSEGSARPYLQEMEFLYLIAKLGIINTIFFFAAFMTLCIWPLVPIMSSHGIDSEYKALKIGLSLGIVGLIISALTNPAYSSPFSHLYIIFLLVITDSYKSRAANVIETTATGNTRWA